MLFRAAFLFDEMIWGNGGGMMINTEETSSFGEWCFCR